MIEQRRELIRSVEAARLGHTENQEHGRPAQRFVEVYRVSVEKCFIPLDFNEELPLYLLDVGGALLLLFGQWLFDPHTLVAPKQAFESWTCDQNFFANFSMRCSREHGTVFEMRVEGCSLIQAERLRFPLTFRRLSEWQMLAGHGDTLVHDLQNAHVVDASPA